MDSSLLQQFKELIALRSGLQLRAQEEGALIRTLAGRVKALRLSSSEEYLALLKRENAEGTAEWRELWVLLTNQESYFFRDTGQFALLRETILPQLIEANRERRTLRLWSAGCSTGEEPYSLAVLVDQLLPKRETWKVSILGTDLSEAALAKARRGIYGGWSFRTKETQLVERYFRKTAAGLELQPRIREMVTFQHGNLIEDKFPVPNSMQNELDLIVCRNVFIYFARDAVDSVVQKFARTLRPGGFFLCGHAELHNLPPEPLQPLLFAETVIYQREERLPGAPRPGVGAESKSPSAPSGRPAAKSPAENGASRVGAPRPAQPRAAATSTAAQASVPDQAKVAGMDPEAILKAANVLIERGAYTAAINALQPLLAPPRHLQAVILAAQASANGGDYELASSRCREAIEMNAFAAEPYHLLAQIAEERGEMDEAKVLLKKVIYLAPSSVAAYLDLDAIYEREGDTARASKMRSAALQALGELEAGAPVPRYEGRTAGQLVEALRLKQKP